MSQEFNGFDEKEKKENEYIYKNVMGQKQATRLFSLLSLISSIISIIFCWVPILGIIFGIVAIVCAIIARREIGYFDGFSIAGLIFGIFGIVFSVTAIILKNILIGLFVSLFI